MTDPALSLIIGAKQIAEALQIDEITFHSARRKGGLAFVWKEAGMGLVTTREAAAEYFRARWKGVVTAAPVPLDKAG